MIENLSTSVRSATVSSSKPDEAAMEGSGEKLEDDDVKKLYPFVDETKTPLPRFWNNGDKYNYLIVTNQNLRVTYRGAGKNHKDAAAVRANFPIPATCGIYYFEITIVSKGRDGYMGIGLSEKEVSLNRLPGWDRNSYGYHADDGNFFSSSGNGTQYGPTFTTNDVVGCGFNLIDNTIFYTKNGQNLGVAFHDVPSSEELYPTVGLQTPGEIVDANFGQKPFVFNIQDEMKEAQMRVQASIFNFQLPATKTEWMNKLVSSYLVHHGFCATAESFNVATNQRTVEDAASMTNRQQIQKLVLNGHIAEAIEMVEQVYPMLLLTNKQLLFMLKCRQFIEMLAQVTQEREPRSSSHHRSSPTCSPPYKQVKRPSPNDREHRLSPRRTRSPRSHEDTPSSSGHVSNGANHAEPMEDGVYRNGSASNGSGNNAAVKNGSAPDEEDMDDADDLSNGFAPPPAPATFEKFRDVLAFGQEINALSKEITSTSRSVQLQRKQMNDAFSLVCYAKPKESPNGYLLDASQRAPVAAALNSAILEDQGQCARPPLEVLLTHARRLRDELANSAKIGAATFADPDRICRGGSLL